MADVERLIVKLELDARDFNDALADASARVDAIMRHIDTSRRHTGYFTMDPSEGEQAPPPFDIGDVVALVSGGPDMTVVNVCECGSVTVAWFLEDELCIDVFPTEALDYVG